MADNVAVTAGTGTTVAADEVVDGTLGTVKVQYVKIMDATLDGTTKAAVGANGLKVDPSSAVALNTGVRSATTQRVTIATDDVVPSSQSGTWTVQPGNTANTTPWLMNVRFAGTAADIGSGTGGTATQRVIMDSSQLAALSTTSQAMSAGFQLVSTPTDQVVANKMQSQNNGLTSSRVDSAASTNATSLKASAGSGVNIDVFNVAAYDVYLKFYNKASSPTVGSDTPVWTIPIKAGTGYARTFPMGKWFSTGIAYAITKLQVDTDTTVVAAHDLSGSIDWI